jgi:hypothetical protein
MEDKDLDHLLEQMLKEINRFYVPETVKRIQDEPALWEKVKGLERRMNHAVLSGDWRALERAIGQYRKIWNKVG